MELSVIDNKGKESGKIALDEALMASTASDALLHEVAIAHLAAQRSGTHSTKTKAEVSGGGIKPWRQKGTGRARAGSIRSPLWRHGGTIFGPKPRSYRQDLPKKKKKLAFKLALSNLISEERFQVVEPIQITEPKTKLVAAVYKKWNVPSDSLLVVDKIDATLNRAAKNIPTVRLVDVETLNAYDCLRTRKLYVAKDAYEKLMARVENKGRDGQ